jgi:hypothetical protein
MAAGAAAVLTPYPQIVEYHEAVQHPATAFRDPELRQGRVETNALGLPVALSGGFALTYPMTTPRRNVALRCFHRDITAGEHKYAAIARALKALNSAYFVRFQYLADGIRIRGGFYPILKMDWAEGDPLGMWLDRHADDRHAVARLRGAFVALAASLEASGVAHGDIQNGNVIVARGGLKLVDYDGMFVPGMPADFACESGHKHFQHPFRSAARFGSTMDRFSLIVVDLSLAALIEDPSLYRRFGQGGETIVFRAGDFAAPERSEVFSLLVRCPALARDALNLAAICRADISAVPTLADFRAGRHIPQDTAPAVPRPAPTAAPAPSRTSANRQIIARMARRRAPASAPRAAASAAPAPPRSGRANQAILQALQKRLVAPAASPPRAVARRPAASAAGAAIAPSSPPPPSMPRAGSVVIHPRNRVPRPMPPPQAAASLTLWRRVQRFLGIG